MNPKLKKIIILAVVLMIVCFGGIFLYTSLSGMSKVTIFDFKIVDENNNLMQDKNVYINETSTNKFKIGVFVEANGADGGYGFKSSNPNVAQAVKYSDGWYVEYYNSGSAKITLQSYVIAELNDSFYVNVYENYFIDVAFEDSDYDNKKTIDVYADGFDYSYKFNLVGLDDSLEQNSRLFRVVETSNSNLFKTAEVNAETNSLELSVKSRIEGKEGIESVVTSSNEYVVLQSYIRDASGNEIVQDNYVVRVNIICNTVEDVQLEFANKFSFDSEKTHIFSMLADEDYAQSLINPENEVLIRKVYCGENIPYLYFKVRLVYANRSVRYITKDCSIDNFTNHAGSVKKQLTNDSMLPSDYVNIFNLYSYNQDRISFNIKYTASDLTNYETVTNTFMFIILKDNLDISELYDYDNESGTYTFSYFDNRLKRFDTITDKNGAIIDFEDQTTGSVYIARYENGYINSYISTTTNPNSLQDED